MRTRRLTAVVVLFATGCGPSGSAPPPTVAHGSSHDHEHTRDKMLLADAGPHHAALTAHLSAKDGNELDVFFETAAADPEPVALPLAGFTAAAARADGKSFPLTFKPAPPDERPKDEKPGTCSHYVAEAAWMLPDDVLTVTTEVPIDGATRKVVWAKFVPRTFAHHTDEK